jgi:hypothetical protein
MAWITNSNISTANLDADTDSPLSARPDIKAALDELIVAGNARGAANGVASLDGDTLVPNTQLPNTLISSGSNNLTLDPGSGKVAIQDILNLNPRTVAQLNALTSAEGDVAYVSNDTDGKALAVYDGSNWKKLTLGATIST